MDHSLHVRCHQFLETLRSRLPKISGVAPKVRLPRWGYFLPLALLASIWAHRGSSEEGRIGWLKSNAPSDEAWSAVLDRKGFRSVEDPAWKEKAYAEMPEASRKKDTALISEDLYTVAVRSGNDWRFFQLGGSPVGRGQGVPVKRELWVGLGLGWEAVSAVDHTEFPQATTKPLDRPQEWVDPRSLQY